MIDKLEFVIALAREQHFGRPPKPAASASRRCRRASSSSRTASASCWSSAARAFSGFTPEGERVLDWARRIVGDARAMRQEIDALKRGLAGHVRIAAIPTALAMTAMLTTPFRAKHPGRALHHPVADLDRGA